MDPNFHPMDLNLMLLYNNKSANTFNVNYDNITFYMGFLEFGHPIWLQSFKTSPFAAWNLHDSTLTY